GYIVEFGSGNMANTRYFDSIAKLQKLASRANYKKRRRLYRCMMRVYKKIENCVKDAHYKCANFLVNNYEEILLPALDTKKLVAKDEHFLSKLTKKQLLTWCHSKFRARLEHKAQLSGKVKIITCNEHYTSMTCGQCGQL